MEQIKRKRLSSMDRNKVYKKFGGHCAYCGKELKFREMQADHKTPLYRGGEDTLENMYPACRSCNFYKSTRTIDEFREYLQGIPKRLMRDDVAYQVGVRFGTIAVHEKPVAFYFEKVGGVNETDRC
jgi:hypothetical protein